MTLSIIHIYLLATPLCFIPSAIIMGRLFVKSGRPFWAAFIPFYGGTVEAQIARLSPILGFLTILYALPQSSLPALKLMHFIGFVTGLFVLNRFIKNYDEGLGWWAGVIFVPFIIVFLKSDAT